MKSSDLRIAQNILKEFLKAEIDTPMPDYKRCKFLIEEIDRIDAIRRDAWHDEKFGPYEKLADQVLNFNSDDIPF